MISGLVLALFLGALQAPGGGEDHPKPKAHAGPKVGEAAPDFVLPGLEGKEKVKLSDFRDKAPVVLVFGSYT